MEGQVRIIKGNPLSNRGINSGLGTQLNIDAYARVSTDSEEQEDSFERQVDYYTRYISANPNWKLVKVYSDPGISGTRAENRPGFQQMIEDCRSGKINRILVKSIAKNEINAIESSYSRATLENKRVEEILNTLHVLELTEKFDDEIFKRLVQSVTINDRCKITFKFKVGLERTIETTIK